ncbi:exopolysaccharide biosynthesis protein [Sphingomonas metalli]|nr:exopolysaccharide biosynthesis protein [Sphingomonas metalli]
MADEPHSLGDVLDTLERLADAHDRVTLGQTVEALGSRSYGPFLLLPALVDISPVGSIPGLPTVLAAIIILTAAQVIAGREHLWLPGFLERRGFRAETVRKTVGKGRGIARRIDGWFHGRLPALTRGPFVRVAAAACIGLACTVPPLELLPLATTAPMAAIAAFGLALLVRDGALMIAAIGLAAGALALGAGLLGRS